jgi:hypothetical protein
VNLAWALGGVAFPLHAAGVESTHNVASVA